MDAQQAGIYQTNFRTVLGAIGGGTGATAGIAAVTAGATVAGVAFGLAVAPFIAIPMMAATAIVAGIGGALVGYTAGEKVDYKLANRNIQTIKPEDVKPIINGEVHETAVEAKGACKSMASWIKKKAIQVYEQHIKGRSPSDLYEEQLLRMPARPEFQRFTPLPSPPNSVVTN